MLPLLSLQRSKDESSDLFSSWGAIVFIWQLGPSLSFMAPVKNVEQAVDDLLNVVHPHQAVDPRGLGFGKAPTWAILRQFDTESSSVILNSAVL